MEGNRAVVGRADELARLDTALDQALRRRGQTLCLAGPPGIGKSTLLDAVEARWPDRLVLRASGVETASELSYDALGELVDPLLDHLDLLPQRQAAALRGALALGPADAADPFAVAAATSTLLRAAAWSTPLLVLVDDVQWLDDASSDCLAHVTRRLGRLPVLAVLARRSGVPVAAWLQDLPTLDLGRLDADACARIVLARSPDTTPDVVTEIADRSDGNPLAVSELLAGLDDDQRCGRAPIPVLPRTAGRLTSVFEQRIGALPDDERLALLVCAAERSDSVNRIATTLRSLDLDPLVLVRLDASGLLRLGEDEVRFTHPLVRSAAYHGADAAERRRVHLGLADVVGEDERGWHLAAAAIGPDAEACRALQVVARRAEDRSAFRTASRALSLASRLAPDPALAEHLAVAAANTAIPANRPADEILPMLDGVLRTATDPTVVSAVRYLRGIVLHRASRDLARTGSDLVVAAASCPDGDLAAAMLALAAYCTLVAGDTTSTLHHAEAARGRLSASAAPDHRAPVLASLAAASTYQGRPQDALLTLLDLQAVLPGLAAGPTALAVPLAMQTMVGLGLYTEARAICEQHIVESRDSGSLTALPFLLTTAADAAYRTGDWSAAEAWCDEAVPLARETDQGSVVLMASCVLARLLAATGRDDQAQQVIDEVLEVSRPGGIGSQTFYALATRLFSAVGRGAVSAGTDTLTELRHVAAASGIVEETMIPWRIDAIEIALAADDMVSALADIEVLREHAEVTGSALARAWARRAAGSVSDDFDTDFVAALALHDGVPSPFERARTLLAYGARLHRSARRVEARTHLHEAVELFDRLGAVPWRERAEAELRAAGGRPQESRSTDSDALTDRERRIAEAVAQGLSNKEVAAGQFLSVKTVEFHLARVYRKLGVRSRTQLAARLLADESR